MPILIDGYNLLFAAGLARPPGWRGNPVSRGGHRGGPLANDLERGRNELLRFLASRLTATERRSTTIVFDAKKSRAGEDAEYEYQGIRILFAHDHHEADDLIEILIRQCPQPHQLLVISSDTRIRTAASRRRAQPQDSDTWLMHLEHERNTSPPESSTPEKPSNSLGARAHEAPDRDDVAHWLAEFDLDMPDRTRGTPLRTPKRDRQTHGDESNPFPPGYGEDIELEGDDS